MVNAWLIMAENVQDKGGAADTETVSETSGGLFWNIDIRLSYTFWSSNESSLPFFEIRDPKNSEPSKRAWTAAGELITFALLKFEAPLLHQMAQV